MIFYICSGKLLESAFKCHYHCTTLDGWMDGWMISKVFIIPFVLPTMFKNPFYKFDFTSNFLLV